MRLTHPVGSRGSSTARRDGTVGTQQPHATPAEPASQGNGGGAGSPLTSAPRHQDAGAAPGAGRKLASQLRDWRQGGATWVAEGVPTMTLQYRASSASSRTSHPAPAASRRGTHRPDSTTSTTHHSSIASWPWAIGSRCSTQGAPAPDPDPGVGPPRQLVGERPPGGYPVRADGHDLTTMAGQEQRQPVADPYGAVHRSGHGRPQGPVGDRPVTVGQHDQPLGDLLRQRRQDLPERVEGQSGHARPGHEQRDGVGADRNRVGKVQPVARRRVPDRGSDPGWRP